MTTREPLLSNSSSVGNFSFAPSEAADSTFSLQEVDPIERRETIRGFACCIIGFLGSIAITTGILCAPLPINNPSYQSTEKNFYLAGVISIPIVWIGLFFLYIHLRNR